MIVVAAVLLSFHQRWSRVEPPLRARSLPPVPRAHIEALLPLQVLLPAEDLSPALAARVAESEARIFDMTAFRREDVAIDDRSPFAEAAAQGVELPVRTEPLEIAPMPEVDRLRQLLRAHRVEGFAEVSR